MASQDSGMFPEKGKRPGLWSWVVAIVFSAVLLYFAVRGVDWRHVGEIIAGARWEYISAAIVITAFSFFVRSLRWRILLNAEGRFGVWTVFWANMSGYLGNNFLPARAGEFLRTYLISRDSTLSKTYIFTTAMSERLMDVVALVLFSALVLLGIEPKPRWMQDVSRSMTVIAVCGVLAMIALPYIEGLLENILARIPLPARLRVLLQGLIKQVLMGIAAFHHWGRLAGFVLLTVVIWTSDAFGVIVGAYALGLHISFPVAVLLLTGLGLGSALPSTPGYVGVYQAAAVTVLMPFGFSRDSALAYILVAQAIGYAVVLAFGLPGLYRFSKGRQTLHQTAV
jgi:uncharacterized protein (TIRG00374 family)